MEKNRNFILSQLDEEEIYTNTGVEYSTSEYRQFKMENTISVSSGTIVTNVLTLYTKLPSATSWIQIGSIYLARNGAYLFSDTYDSNCTSPVHWQPILLAYNGAAAAVDNAH